MTTKLDRLVLLSSFLLSSESLAQMLVDPSTVAPAGKVRAAGIFSAAEVDYETDNTDFDIERKILAVEFASGMAPDVDIVGDIGLITDSEIDNVDADGDGYVFGFGVRSVVHKESNWRASAFGIFSYQSEEFEGDNDWTLEVDSYDIHTGAVALFLMTPKFQPYAGLDLALYSDGSAKVKGSGRGKEDIERDDLINLKFGANFNFTRLTLRPELTLFGEKTFSLALGTVF